MKVAIVGCGISGANTLKSILDNKNYNDDIYIDIFESRKELAVGLAYENDDPHKILNTPIEHMNIVVEDKNHFKNWLKSNYGTLPLIEDKAPRPIFGKYAKYHFSKYFKHKNVKIINSDVEDLDMKNGEFSLKTASDNYDDYSAVFLCIGQSYYKDAYNLKNCKNYIANPYPLDEKISNIKKNDQIGIIGTGPSSIDIYRYLSEYFEFEYPLYFFTQSSFFALPEIRVNPPSNICSIDDNWIKKHRKDDGFIDLSDFEKSFNSDFKKASVDFEEIYQYYKDNNPKLSKEALTIKDRNLEFCQSYCLELWYVSSKLYNSFYVLDRKRFRGDYLPKIVYLMTKTPGPSMTNILKDLDCERIKVLKHTENISIEDDKFKVEVKGGDIFFVDKLFNAQGFEKNLTKAIENDHLLRNLYDKRLIDADVNKKINVSYPSYNPITSKYGQIENLYINGMWTESIDISNNDLRSMLISSKQMADDFMNKIK